MTLTFTGKYGTQMHSMLCLFFMEG